MIDFSERKEQYGRLEKELVRLKAEYQSQKMPKDQVELLRSNMKKARSETEKKEPKRKSAKLRYKYAAAAAAMAGAFIILPNTSAAAADAMERIPVIGQIGRAHV